MGRDEALFFGGRGGLPDELARSAFENEVLDACRPFYPVREHGKILYPFRRIFFIAYAS